MHFAKILKKTYYIMSDEKTIFEQFKNLLPAYLQVKTTIQTNNKTETMNGEQYTFYDQPSDTIYLGSNYIDDFIDEIYNNNNLNQYLYQNLNQLNKDNPSDQMLIEQHTSHYKMLLNNPELKQEVVFSDRERELLKQYIVSHELGHAIFMKHDKDDMDLNLNDKGISFTEEQRKHILSGLNTIDTSEIDTKGNAVVKGNPYMVRLAELQADTFAVYMMYQTGEPVQELNQLFEKIRDVRYKNNYLSSGFAFSTHNTESVFSPENILNIRSAPKDNLLEHLDNLADKAYINLLKEHGFRIKQSGLDNDEIKQTTTIKEAFEHEWNNHIDGLRNYHSQHNNPKGLQVIDSIVNQNVELFAQLTQNEEKPIEMPDKDKIIENLDLFTKALEMPVIVSNGIIEHNLDSKTITNVSDVKLK